MSNDTQGLYASFQLDAVEMPFLSSQAGRPIFEDREFIRIFIAGDKNSEIYREVRDEDRERFVEVYDRFKRGLKDEDQNSGTPLAQWPIMKPREIKELQAVNLFTVEQVASVSDSVKQKLGMGANEIVAKARAWLNQANQGADLSKYMAENSRLKIDLEALQAQVQQLSDRLEGEAVAKRSPGRPPRSAKDDALS